MPTIEPINHSSTIVVPLEYPFYILQFYISCVLRLYAAVCSLSAGVGQWCTIPIPESESIPESALFWLESESEPESEISKCTGIGTGIGIRELGLGIGIRNFKSGPILIFTIFELAAGFLHCVMDNTH